MFEFRESDVRSIRVYLHSVPLPFPAKLESILSQNTWLEYMPLYTTSHVLVHGLQKCEQNGAAKSAIQYCFPFNISRSSLTVRMRLSCTKIYSFEKSPCTPHTVPCFPRAGRMKLTPHKTAIFRIYRAWSLIFDRQGCFSLLSDAIYSLCPAGFLMSRKC